MEWFKAEISWFRQPEYVGSNPVERSTWVSLLVHCVQVENGGVLKGAAKWKDRQWQQMCGVTLREVRCASKLIEVIGDDVHVWKYPIQSELEVKARRKGGADGGNKRWHANTEAYSSATSSPITTASSSSNGSGNRVTDTEKSRVEKITPLPPRAEPKGWEGSLEKFQAACAMAGVPKDFLEQIWLEHDASGIWQDRSGRPIGNPAAYVKSRWMAKQSAAAERSSRFAGPVQSTGKAEEALPVQEWVPPAPEVKP